MNFEQPQKLASLALLRVFSKLFRSVFSQLWPLLVIYFFQTNKTDDSPYDNHWSLIVIYAALILTALVGCIRYFTFRWFLEQDALVIRYGWLRKVNLRIPFDKIQTVDLQQPWYYRFTNTTRFLIDTAGSKKKEAEIWALQTTTAEALRKFILEQKSSSSEVLEKPDSLTSDEETITASLSLRTFLLVGIFKNHFRSILAFVGGGFYLYSQLQRIFDIELINQEIQKFYGFIPKAYTLAFIFTFLVLVASILFSLVRTIITFYGFKMTEHKNTLLIKYGLLSIKTRQIQFQKIQLFKTVQGPFFRFFKLTQFKVQQAYAKEGTNKKTFQLPGCPELMAERLTKRIFGEFTSSVHPGTSVKWIWYRITRLGLPFAIAFAIASIVLKENMYLWGLLCLPLQATYSYLLWKNQNVGVDANNLIVRRKILWQKQTVLKLEKVQAIKITKTLYQRRNSLASLHVETAGGGVLLPFLPEATVQKLANYFIYKSEISGANWM